MEVVGVAVEVGVVAREAVGVEWVAGVRGMEARLRCRRPGRVLELVRLDLGRRRGWGVWRFGGILGIRR